LFELDSKIIQGGLHQRICEQQLLVAMYSALAVESATLFCFFDNQEASDLPNS
jgi:hypothetical protein